MSKVDDQRIAEFRWSLAFVGKATLNDLIVGEEARGWLKLDSWQGMSADGGIDE